MNTKCKWIILFLVSLFLFPGCYETRNHGYKERRSLMMMKQSEYDRNKGVYKESNTKKKLDKKIKKSMKKAKRKLR